MAASVTKFYAVEHGLVNLPYNPKKTSNARAFTGQNNKQTRRPGKLRVSTFSPEYKGLTRGFGKRRFVVLIPALHIETLMGLSVASHLVSNDLSQNLSPSFETSDLILLYLF